MRIHPRDVFPNLMYGAGLGLAVTGAATDQDSIASAGFVLIILWIFGIHPWSREP